MSVNILIFFACETQIRTKFRTQNSCSEMDKLGTQCSNFGYSKRKKGVKKMENFVELKVKEVQMKNLDRTKAFSDISFVSGVTKFANFARLPFSHFTIFCNRNLQFC